MSFNPNQMASGFNCPQCDLVFPDERRLAMHGREHITFVTVRYSDDHEEIINKQDDRRFHCTHCSFHTSAPGVMIKHGRTCWTNGVPPSNVQRPAPSPVDQNPQSVESGVSAQPSEPSSNVNPTGSFFSNASHSTVPVSGYQSDASSTRDVFRNVASNESLSIVTSLVEPGDDAPSFTPVAQQSTTSEATVQHSDSTPAATPASDDQDNLATVPTTIDSTAYVKYQPFFGLVVHSQSGATICLHCRKAFLLSSIVSHFMATHRFAVFVSRHNQIVSTPDQKIVLDKIQPKLVELGAKNYDDMGFYISPTQTALPVIDVLEVKKGYMCNLCPAADTTSTAFFTPKISTMNNHFSKLHKGANNDNYTPCYIQNLYGDRGHLKYFKVERYYNGPTIPSTITADGDAKFKAFLAENPDFASTTNCSTMVSDTRVQSRFYTKVHWYGLKAAVCGEDTTENRVLLHDWVNNLWKRQDNRHTTFDNQLQKLVRGYFNYIQGLLEDGSLHTYYERCITMHEDSNAPFPKEGFNALRVKTRNKYFDLYFKYVKMLMFGVSDSVGSHQSGCFRTFGEKVINDDIKQATLKFIDDIKQMTSDVAIDDAALMKQAFPVIHAYFYELISEKTPPTRQMFRSSIMSFTAFQQLTYLGQWKAVRHIKQTPVILRYCFRSIAFMDMLLEKGDLDLEDDVLMGEPDGLGEVDNLDDYDDMTTDDSSFED